MQAERDEKTHTSRCVARAAARDTAGSVARDSCGSCLHFEYTLCDFALPLARNGVANDTHFAGSVSKLTENWPCMFQRQRDGDGEHDLQLSNSHVNAPIRVMQKRNGPLQRSSLWPRFLRSNATIARIMRNAGFSHGRFETALGPFPATTEAARTFRSRD